ncbi:MAG TPA: hypothetical protein VIO61_13905 [Anaerolineaceae bacterium]
MRSTRTFQLILLLTILEGIVALLGLISLPPSEEGNALVGGISFFRLGYLILVCIMLAGLAGLWIYTLMKPDWYQFQAERIRIWFFKHSFTSSAIIALIFAWIMGVGLLDLLLNPNLFPRAILYQYLYMRVRPVFLWLLITAVQFLILVYLERWFHPITLPSPPSGTPFGSLIGGGIITIVLTVNVILWLFYVRDPLSFQNRNAWLNGVFVFLGAALICGVGLRSISRKIRK